MKYNAIALIKRGAEALHAAGDDGTAYALYELANNLRLLMRGEANIEEWNKVYVGRDVAPINIDAVLPIKA